MIVFASVIFGGQEYEVTLYRWIGAGDFEIEIGFFVDALTAMLLLVVSRSACWSTSTRSAT